MEGVKKFISIFSDQVREDGAEYAVKVFSYSGTVLFTRTFKTRLKARAFKNLMKDSTPAVECHIIKRVWDSGLIDSEEEVW